jgi:uncharacterized RDD family membrane protein YckC
MDEQNPYRAPATQIVDVAAELHLPIEPAGRWRRFFNLSIDYACCRLISMGLLLVFLVLIERWGVSEFFLGTEEDPKLAFLLLWSVTAIPAYYICMEGLLGLTIGKLVTGTRVVNERGGKPSLAQIVGRSLSRLIPFDPLSLFFSSDDECRAWHDSLSKTRVVRKR